MAWLSENNVDANQAEKLQKYQQLAFEIRERERERERQPEYNAMIIPIVIGCSGGGMRRVTN